jgi:hypothetical protein
MGRAIQQNAQMLNMMSQQRAAERQAAQAAQEMEFARAAEGRAAAEEGRKITQFEIEQADRQFEYHGKRATVVNTPQGYEMWLAGVGKDSREMADFIRANLPPEQFSVDPERGRDLLIKLVGSLKQNFDATYGPKESQVQVRLDGTPLEIVTGGFGKPGAYPVEQYELAPQGGNAAPPPPPAASGASARPTQGTATAPADLRAQGVDPRSIPSGNPLQPISMTTGPQMGGQPDLTGIVEQMMSSGQISQSNLQLMRDAAGPDKDAQLAEILKANNIQIVPDEQPSLRSAVFRPGEDAAPQMQQVQAREGYVPTGRAARVKDPMQSPAPGSTIVPIERIQRESDAERPSPQRVYEEELAREKAKLDAAAGRPKPLTPVQETKLRDNIAKDFKAAQSTLDMMLAPDTGVVAAVDAVRKLSPTQKEAVTGFSGYVPSVLPSSRSADTAIKNLQGKVTQMGKATASLSGAIGQMAVQEWKIVSDMIAALDVTGMEPADLDNQLDIIEATARRAAQTTRDAYESQYAEEFARYPGRFILKEPARVRTTPGKKAETAIPRVRSDADYNRLKPGTVFIDPNGQRRRKPR